MTPDKLPPAQTAQQVVPTQELPLLRAAEQELIAQEVLDETFSENLRPITLGLAIIFVGLAIMNAWTLSPDVAPIMVIVAGLTAVIIFGIHLILRRRTIPVRLAYPIGVIISLIAYFNNFLRLYLTGDPEHTINLIIIVIANSLFFLSARWLIFSLLMGIGGWGILALAIGPIEEWLSFGLSLLVACGISVLVYLFRARTLQRYEHLRQQDERHAQELRYRAGQLETSIDIAQSITSILDVDTLLNRVVELIRDRYGYYFIGIFLLEAEGQFVRERASAGVRGVSVEQGDICLRVGEDGLIGWVAANGRLLCIDDVRQDDRYLQLDGVSETRSELVLPLRVGDTLLGVLDLQSKQVAAFAQDDVPFLQLVSDQVAIAIYNASLYQGERNARRLAEMLHQTGHILNSTLDWSEVLDLILEQLVGIVPYDRAAMLVPRGVELEFVAFWGFPDTFQPSDARISIDRDADEIYREIYETQRPLAIPDVAERPDWQQVESLPLARSWLGVPLIRSQEVMGMLSLTRETLKPYNNEEIELASAFASQAALAMQNARLYDRLARFNQQLEYEVRSRTSAVQEAYEQLERLNQTKSDFISVVSHELRTPLTIVQGYSQMLLNDKNITSNEFHQQLVDGIYGGAIRLGEIVNSMLDMLKIDNRALDLYPEPVSIESLIHLVVSTFEQSLVERSLTLKLENLETIPAIEADLEALQKVFYHLVINAIKYTPDGGTITISGHPLVDSDIDLPREGIEVVVADTGIGIAPDARDLIFTKFYQTGKVALHSSGKTAFKGGGPGLGLAIARGIIEAHRGKLWVESPGYDEEQLPGSEFHVALPLRQR